MPVLEDFLSEVILSEDFLSEVILSEDFLSMSSFCVDLFEPRSSYLVFALTLLNSGLHI